MYVEKIGIDCVKRDPETNQAGYGDSTMEAKPAKDLEAQKAKDPVPNATVADDPDKSQNLSEHAAPVSPVPLAKSDHIHDESLDVYQKVWMDLNGVRLFIFFKRMNDMNILNLEAELKKTQRNVFEAETSGQSKEVYMTRLEDQLHRYSKALIEIPWKIG